MAGSAGHRPEHGQATSAASSTPATSRRSTITLAAKGIRTGIYGDHLVERVRGKGSFPNKTRTGFSYAWPGALTPEQVVTDIPKDILIFNWFWREGKEGSQARRADLEIKRWGFTAGVQ